MREKIKKIQIHSWSLQGLINHEWGASLTDVGLGCQANIGQSAWGENPKDHTRGREQNLVGLAPQRGQTACGVKYPTLLFIILK